MDAEVAQIAAALAGARVEHVERVRRGGNNRVFRVVTAGGTFALKNYPVVDADPRDRLRHEFEGLRFLRAWGERAVPDALACDRPSGYALYEWIDGDAVREHGVPDVEQAVAFLARLRDAAAAPEAAALPDAAEAVFEPSELDAQVARRFERLEAVAAGEPELAAFLGRLRAAWAALRAPAEPRVTRRTLSPSDFGFHNALRRPDGGLVFVDFEYFGWDDPVKLVCDVLWHPGMTLAPDERAAFREGAAAVFGGDPDFERRFRRDMPRYGVRWALIVLNEFLPQAWERRVAAGRTGDWAQAKAGQLAKSTTLLNQVLANADTE